MRYLAKSIHMDCEKQHTFTLISELITMVISAPLFYKCNFIYKYPLSLLAMYAGISTSPNSWRDINPEETQLPHFDCYTGKTMLLCDTTLFQNISKSDPPLQWFQRQKWQFTSYATTSQRIAKRVQIITRFMHEAPPQQEEIFCTYPCTHGYI